jgi:hypothetical protein
MQRKDLKINELLIKIKASPIVFVEVIFGLKAPELDPKYIEQFYLCIEEERYSDVKANWFEKFKRGQMTWQQFLILKATEQAIKGGRKRISISSGHGIGKSAVLSWLMLWFLFSFYESQVACTAPTSAQMHDVLWKEASKWINKMNPSVKAIYEWTSSYIRMKDRPATWFARAKTAKKEEPEALAGVHGDNVMILVDEASGVPEPVFQTAEGALTNENVLMIMASNPTRNNGFFYESHKKQDKENWRRLEFNSEESPIVDNSFVRRIITKYGKDSDEYKIRVKGEFPSEDALDDKGYVPLLTDKDLHYTNYSEFVGRKRIGIDPSGEGQNKTIWVVRDKFKAKVVASESVSNPKSIADRTLTLLEHYDIGEDDIWVDAFGEGANVGKELALAAQIDANCENVGKEADDKEAYINKRAEAFFRLRKWLRAGGELIMDKRWEELLEIKYRRTLDGNGKIQIKSKKDMKKDGVASPDVADALMLTFLEEEETIEEQIMSAYYRKEEEVRNKEDEYE